MNAPRYATVGETFEHLVTLDEAGIASFATAMADNNPLHHDREHASKTRFGGIIASGPHTAGIFMGMTATHLSARGAALGLEFNLRFVAAARSGRTLHMRWEVIEVVWSERLKGELIAVSGAVTDDTGLQVLTGTGKLLVTDKL
jgi:3-hydroxybutyryl-CoA dehydratase